MADQGPTQDLAGHRRRRLHRFEFRCAGRSRIARTYASWSSDKLTYAGSRENLRGVDKSDRMAFFEGDIASREDVAEAFRTYRPTHVLNFAAESHVDRSIDGPRTFIETNIHGTFELLEAARVLHDELEGDEKGRVPLSPRLDRRGLRHPRPGRLLHRRDALSAQLALFRFEGQRRSARPRLSPHLRLPTVTTNCSNNYDPINCPRS